MYQCICGPQRANKNTGEEAVAWVISQREQWAAVGVNVPAGAIYYNGDLVEAFPAIARPSH